MKKPIYHLDRWYVAGSSNPYTAPELHATYLIGERDGETVQTSDVLNVEGRLIETKNSFYILREPSPPYAAWCKEQGKPIDEENPIKLPM